MQRTTRGPTLGPEEPKTPTRPWRPLFLRKDSDSVCRGPTEGPQNLSEQNLRTEKQTLSFHKRFQGSEGERIFSVPRLLGVSSHPPVPSVLRDSVPCHSSTFPTPSEPRVHFPFCGVESGGTDTGDDPGPRPSTRHRGWTLGRSPQTVRTDPRHVICAVTRESVPTPRSPWTPTPPPSPVP